MSDTTPAPRAEQGQEMCGARTSSGVPESPWWLCNAAAGHDGDHAAYAGPGNLCHAWPRASLAGWDDTVREAFRNAIAYQHEHQGADWRDQVALYRSVAARFGLDLGTGLDGPHGIVLAAADLETVMGALDHAEQLMRERVDAFCETCATSPAEACYEHLDQLDMADAYKALARRLGGAR